MIEIQLDKPRKVEFTMRAFRTYKIDTGHSILSNGIAEVDEEVMVDLTFAGLIGADKDMSLTKDEISDYLDFPVFKEVLEEMKGGIKKLQGDEKK